jgi:hypothetical protein
MDGCGRSAAGGQVARVTIEISGAVGSADPLALPEDTRRALETDGRTELLKMLGHDDPPRVIRCDSTGCTYPSSAAVDLGGAPGRGPRRCYAGTARRAIGSSCGVSWDSVGLPMRHTELVLKCGDVRLIRPLPCRPSVVDLQRAIGVHHRRWRPWHRLRAPGSRVVASENQYAPIRGLGCAARSVTGTHAHICGPRKTC